ncbi:MAG TPA: sigma-54 dependent transcriptional regulator [Terriglobales bacterium]
MRKTKVLLINLNPKHGSGDELKQLLETCTGKFDLKHKRIAEREQPSAARHLSAVLSSFSPDLAFLIFGANSEPVIASLFAVFRASRTPLPVIAVANTGEQKAVAEVLCLGAKDFLIPPFRSIDVLPRIWRWVADVREEESFIRLLKNKLGLKQFIGDSPAFLAEIKKLPAVARSNATALIAGETGTGKGICARAIHRLSPRASKPFLAVNCGATPVELLENELFGHDPEAFTSAVSSSRGLIRSAEGGTLFLDEIDSLPLPAQAKLLRFLEDKEFRSLGSDKTCKADLRVIAAANVNLEQAVCTGKFRQDLLYRLNVFTITLPPLRQRQGDIPLLARFFIAKFTTDIGRSSKNVTPAGMQKLSLYEWPGNVRQLQNVIERSVVLSEEVMMDVEDFDLPRSASAAGVDSLQALKAILITDFEHNHIQQLLEISQGNVSKAARAAGTDRRSFQRLIQKHRIDMRPSDTPASTD